MLFSRTRKSNEIFTYAHNHNTIANMSERSRIKQQRQFSGPSKRMWCIYSVALSTLYDTSKPLTAKTSCNLNLCYLFKGICMYPLLTEKRTTKNWFNWSWSNWYHINIPIEPYFLQINKIIILKLYDGHLGRMRLMNWRLHDGSKWMTFWEANS